MVTAKAPWPCHVACVLNLISEKRAGIGELDAHPRPAAVQLASARTVARNSKCHVPGPRLPRAGQSFRSRSGRRSPPPPCRSTSTRSASRRACFTRRAVRRPQLRRGWRCGTGGAHAPLTHGAHACTRWRPRGYPRAPVLTRAHDAAELAHGEPRSRHAGARHSAGGRVLRKPRGRPRQAWRADRRKSI